MEAIPDLAQLQRPFVDHVQWRYELMRPVVLIGSRTAAPRAAETQTHPDTVRKLTRRLRPQGRLGFFPEHPERLRPSRGKQGPEAVVEELARLQALYAGWGDREWARLIWHTLAYRLDAKTIKRLWPHQPMPVQGERPCGAYHHPAER